MLFQFGKFLQENSPKKGNIWQKAVAGCNISSLIPFMPQYYSILQYNRTTIQVHHTTIQAHHTTSMHPSKAKRLKKFLSVVGEKGVNLKTLMEEMNLRNRSSFVNAYITPNLVEGYIAMLYPESPNHPMQSYYLTNKGREALNNL